MPEKELILTYEGLKNLEEELEYLKTTKKMEVAERIKEARGFGDLSENSEYDDAKNEQAEVEARILTIEGMLRIAKVVSDDEVSIKAVGIGNKVKVLDVSENEEVEYIIVGSTEVDALGLLDKLEFIFALLFLIFCSHNPPHGLLKTLHDTY